MIHPLSPAPTNDSNNNSINSSSSSSSTKNSSTISPLRAGTNNSRSAARTVDTITDHMDTVHFAVSDGTKMRPEPIDALQHMSSRPDSSAMAPHSLTQSSSPSLSSPPSSSSSPASSSPSPTLRTGTDILVDRDSSEARCSPTNIPSRPGPQSARTGTRTPGLSFGIDRILGSSSSSSSSSGGAGSKTPHTCISSPLLHGAFSQRAHDSTDAATPTDCTKLSSEPGRLTRSRHASLSEESDGSPYSATPADACPDRPVGIRDLDKDGQDASVSESDRSVSRVTSLFSNGQRAASLVDNVRVMSTTAAAFGHLTRPGHPEFVLPAALGDFSSHTGHSAPGPHNPYHSTAGLFLPQPPSDICRAKPCSPANLPSLELLPVRPILPDVFVCPWTGVQRDRFGLVRRIGHPYQNRTPPKRKKPRTAFTRQQVLELEKRFARQKYLASAERSSLAKSLGMSDAQVKTWFQNRRTKWRRQTAEEREIERQAAHKFLLSLRPEETSRPLTFPATAAVSMCPSAASQPARLQQQQQQPELAAVASS